MRAADVIGEAIVKAAQDRALKAAKREPAALPATFLGMDSEGKGWVLLPGAESPTPVRRMAVEASVDDRVSVTVGHGRAVVESNISNPSAGLSGVRATAETAQEAKSEAVEATGMAQAAQAAAKGARAYAQEASRQSARALESADFAQRSAGRAHEAADAAIEDASTARTAAESAVTDAAVARVSADSAQRSADAAATAAGDALVQLSVVEDVVGTASWIAEHATYAPTEDEEVDVSKVYFTRSGAGTDEDPYVYTAVAEPTDEGLSGYYEMDVSEAVSVYGASHLALTDAGLYVLKDESGYKLLLANDGVTLIDPDGHVVVSYGESVSTSPDRAFYIGNDDAYVTFLPATQLAPARVVIGGNVTLGDGRTLAELLAELDAPEYDHTYALAGGTYMFTAHLWKHGADLADPSVDEVYAGLADSMLWWKLRTEAGEHDYGTGRTKAFSAAAAGYRGTVVGGIADYLDAGLLVGNTADPADTLVDSSGDRLVAHIVLEA